MKLLDCATARQLIPGCLQEDLAPSESEQLAIHLEQCPDCRARLEAAAADSGDWQRLPACGQTMLAQPAPVGADAAGWTTQSAADFAVHYLSPARSPDAIGELDDIEILDIVGRGGMGIVLKGRQPTLQRLVAVKLLRPELAEQVVARQRFAREAQAMAAVVQANVLPIHAIRLTGRLPYLVMPFLDCESLEQRLSRQGVFELVDVLTIGLQVARALEAAHAQGLVHRDVKPSNILLERAGPRVWLADFGLARAYDDVSLTHSGLIAGTPLYMSPEQARGEAIDARSDLFSLGSVLYELCTGRSPFRAETTYGVIRRICDSPARPLRALEPTLPEWLQQLITRLHAKDRQLRIASATELAAILERALRRLQQPDAGADPLEIAAGNQAIAHLSAANLGETAPQYDTTEHPPAWRPWLLFRQPLVLAFLIGGTLMTTALASVVVGLAALGFLNVPGNLNGSVSGGDAPTTPMAVLPSSTAPVPATPTVAEWPQFDQRAPLAVAQADTTPPAEVVNDTKYASAREAMSVAAGYLTQKEYAKSREPLEAALKLAPDDVFRVRVYRALIPAYTQAENWLLKVDALDFIITHSEQPAERSLARSEMLSFVRQRGKSKEFVQRYEKRLEAKADDETALFILTETYSRLTDEPQKAAKLLERLISMKRASGEELSVRESAQLASEYVKARKYKEGAELYEATAKRDAALAAWHYKEAATAWLQAKDKPRALAAAKASAASTPEQRSQLLEYFWNRNLADVFVEVGEPATAVPHYETALGKTTIEGYVKETEQRLARARELVK